MRKFLWLLALLVLACGNNKNNGDGSTADSDDSDSGVDSRGSGVDTVDIVDTVDSGTVGGDSDSATVADSDIAAGEFFDDFSYAAADATFSGNDWSARSGGGGPGPAERSWSPQYVTFESDPALAGNTLMRLFATTDGSGAGSVQSQVTTSTRFLEGTYAARVLLTDVPVTGNDGDQIVETFYTITPWSMAAEDAYSEIDFEYLANGGWGTAGPTLFETTWEKAEPVVNEHGQQTNSIAGWHLLLFTVADGEVTYYLDGNNVATHVGIYYPESPMSINFNLWFIEGGFIAGNATREYEMKVDWVYHAKDTVLSSGEVEARVVSLRGANTAYLDTVP
jgi:hypothetical protein